ncbi:ATP synthase F1 subunit gamma [Candidatus Daviesbacteria bacterium]|nr:ATP synthase F1 subunit gamma [Candidatus Daviesbacteria bacterium]
MANTRELRRRIRSIKNTSQITKAMQMVAATKMRRAQVQAESGDPYAQTLNESLKRLTSAVDPTLNPLLQENEGKDIGVIVLSTDKGLVGALNTNLFRQLLAFQLRVVNLRFYTIGKKGRQFVVKIGKELVADFESSDTVTFRQSKLLARTVKDSFLKGELKEVYLVYPDFISTLRQEPRIEKLLPISADALEIETGLTNSDTTTKPRGTRDTFDTGDTSSNEFLFEPSTSELLDFILNHSIETKIYKALLETKASEHSARMIAMKNATDNAKDLVEDLTLSYNQTRQQAITNELLEITTAQAALE